jgi:outer membrane lipoprotein SlyB
MIARLTILPALIIVLCANSSWGQRYTRQGAVVGGATGAVIGGLIGKQTDKTTGGALIGGAVGAVAGSVMGNKYDTDLARQRHVHHQALHAQQQYYAQQFHPVQGGVSMTDVVAMSRSGVSETVIMSQVQSRGIQRRLEVSDIISLHQQGIGDAVISAMQNAPVANHAQPVRSPQPVIVQQPSVIVHEQPVIYSSPPVFYEHYRAYPVYRRGYSMGF